MEEEEKPTFNFKQHIPKRFSRSYMVRIIVYILGFSVSLGFLFKKWNNPEINKNKVEVVIETEKKDVEVIINPKNNSK